MILLPAIDLLGGLPVRLQKGKFETAHRVAENALQTAKSFEEAGAKWVHMVDLDGAKDGEAKNKKIIFEVAQKTGLLVEVGGGIRDLETIEEYLNAGVARVVLGSAAVESPELVRQAVNQYKEKIAVGIDSSGGFVAARGWLCDTGLKEETLAQQMQALGVQTLIVTDIAKDGMMRGPNFSQLKNLQKAVSCNIVASGGIHSYDDLKKLADLQIYGAILGKSIYEGAIDLQKAVGEIG